MNLTGKCKEEFEKWRMKQNYDVDAPFFYELNYSMQYGVYVDFFDSVGLYIEITHDNKDIKTFWVDINGEDVDDYIGSNNRTEARLIAIKKANEIYNN
jgi:hypothetical protein